MQCIHLEFFVQVGPRSHGALHHVWGDGKVLWQLLAPLDHPRVRAIHALVAEEPVFLPVLHTVL